MSEQSTQPRWAIRMRVADVSLNETARAVRRGPGRGLRQAQRVIDAETRRLPAEDRGPVACEAGCDFCCHLRVMATAPEVFALLDYLGQTLDASEFDAFVERVQSTDDALRALSSDRILRTNLACPALVDGRCSGYAARPLNCRSYHSLSREACETSFHNPEDIDQGHPEIRPLAEVHQGGQAGYAASLERAGYDARQYELASALAEALRDPAARRRLEQGRDVFESPLQVPDP
jgi:Fe-S-cluster containining protein